MSSAPSPNNNKRSNPVAIAGMIAAGALALVVAIVLLAQFAIGSYSGTAAKESAAFAPEAIAARVKPVGTLVVDPAAPGIAKPADAAAAPAAAPAPAASPAPAAAPAAEKAADKPAAEAKPEVVAAAAPAAAAPAADAGKGKATYDTICQACHAAGVMNAPKFGDKAAWGPRIATGMDSLYKSAIGGKNTMPAKGGNPALADADVKAAVDYMVAASK